MLHNDDGMAKFARETVVDVFGETRLNIPEHPSMAAEDFAFYLEQVPGAYLFLGNRAEGVENAPTLHHPQFNFNDDALPTGIELLSQLAIRSLRKS